MRINIVSSDERYKIVNEYLCKNGFCSKLCTPKTVDSCDYLLLSVREEFDENELVEIISKINEKTVVLCGKDKRICSFFNGRIIDYSSDTGFVIRNAYLTAEATVSFLHTVTKDSIAGKRIFVSGYGRIGRELCKILKNIGAVVFAYARRKEICELAERDGISSSNLEKSVECDIIINTVPSPIFSKELISQIPFGTTIIELASKPYGFADMERVVIGSGLPGKILPYSAALIIYDTIYDILSHLDEEYL